MKYKLINCGVCGHDSHILSNSVETSVQIGKIRYAITGCDCCVDEKIKELRRKNKK